MGKTKGCYIVSECNGYALNVDPDTNTVELTSRSRDLWKKHNWLIEKVVRDESDYDDGFVEGKKSASGHLQHIDTGNELAIAGDEITLCGDCCCFTWTYDDGFLFHFDNPGVVLEAYDDEEKIAQGGVRMAEKTGGCNQRWRILQEYEGEDTEFRPAFALGRHKMDASDDYNSQMGWIKTKRMVKPYNNEADLEFPDVDIKDIEWKRPDEIVREPKSVKDGISRFDINQGHIGDCWAVSTIANLASTTKHNPRIMEQIFDKNQSFDDGNHTFTFNFFRNGEWREVTVDDYLPWNTTTQKLLFCASTDKEEFWPSLMEKAYAKFKSSYADLVGGFMSWALNDMTGDEWKEDFENFRDSYRDVCDSVASHGLVLAGCRSGYWVGLVGGHAYSITGFGGDVTHGKCVRLRNPWGTGEYEGKVSNVLNDKDDGEFVVPWDVFCDHFFCITIKE